MLPACNINSLILNSKTGACVRARFAEMAGLEGRCGRGGGIMGETRERGKFFLGGDGQASHAHHPTRRDLPADHGTAVAVVTDYGEVARG